jgi:PAS domain S-box-containing protein
MGLIRVPARALRTGGDALPARVVAFVALLACGAAAAGGAVAALPAPGTPEWWTLPVLGALLVAGTWFVVPFRLGEDVDAVNLVEAALAPLLLAFAPGVVVAVVAVSQVANGALRRLPPVKTIFNAAMWALAAAVAAWVLSLVLPGPVWPHQALGLAAALAAAGLVNTAAMAVVMALAAGEPLRRVAVRVVPVVRLGWIAGWAVNTSVGLLFSLAYLAWPGAVLLFGLPLVVLHLAYRSYSTSRADQQRLVAVHRAASVLAEPLDPLRAVPRYLRAVAECFAAEAAELILRTPDGRQVHRYERAAATYRVRAEDDDVASLAGTLAASPTAVRTRRGRDDPAAAALATAGAADCLAAPLLDGHRSIGAIAVLDRGGFEGSHQGELAVIEALGRETADALVRGRLLADVLGERRKLAEIVASTSDGICTLAADGTVLTWNPAFEAITGLRAADVVGRPGALDRLDLRTPQGRRVRLRGRSPRALPESLHLTAVDGRVRILSCTYSRTQAEDEEGTGAALIVFARDVTPAEEHEALRAQLSELVEADAARRAVVDQLQQAVIPGPLSVPGTQMAAAYEASDPTEPTGGDLFDWQLLPSGEVHLAVVDVLGHGVAATKDALAVVHTLRVATADGTPLGDLVSRADELLTEQHPDLVATVIVARYDPVAGRLRVASGGHPPALLIRPDRGVEQVTASGGVIGWPGAGSDGIVETTLEPGDALLLYTDGLVEARKDILDGMEDLVAHAADVAHLDAEGMARELVRRALAGAERRDDTLALVLRREPIASRVRSAGRVGT